MKIIFLATSRIALLTFYSLLKFHNIVAVVSQKNRAQGRSKELVPSPIARAAEKEKIKLYQPSKIDADLIKELKGICADIFLTFSYGVILTKDFFSITKYGGINIHPSLLPELRGPSPIQTAILKGISRSGITIQKMKLKVDSGDILFQENFEILSEENALDVEEKVSTIASKAINPVLSKIENESIKAVPQNERDATYCRIFKKNDGLINWDNDANNIINKIRAFVKWPVAYSFIDGIRINIYKARINNELSHVDFKDHKNGQVIFADKAKGLVLKSNNALINIELLQQKGKKKLNWKDFINGFKGIQSKTFEMEK